MIRVQIGFGVLGKFFVAALSLAFLQSVFESKHIAPISLQKWNSQLQSAKTMEHRESLAKAGRE